MITAVDASGAWVDVAGELLFCRVRGRLYDAAGSKKHPVAPGDIVLVTHVSPGAGVVEEIRPRRTWLSRPSGQRGDKEQILAANVDQLAIVVAVKNPPLRVGLIDRLIVAARNQQIEPFVVINKVDLGRRQKVDEVSSIFTELGYRVLRTCATEGGGVEDLIAALAGKTTIFAGHSGVGKTSLLRRIDPSLTLKVGDVSRSTGKGCHTTTRAQLLRLPAGGYVVDTPGVRAFGLWDLDPADLDVFFNEFEPFIEKCRYYDCTHEHEPACAIRDALSRGVISEPRYKAYLRILETLRE